PPSPAGPARRLRAARRDGRLGRVRGARADGRHVRLRSGRHDRRRLGGRRGDDRVRGPRARPHSRGAGGARRRRALQPAGYLQLRGRRAAPRAGCDDVSSMTDEPSAFSDVVASPEDVVALYGSPVEAVVNKIIGGLDGHCRDFIALAPFVLIGTADQAGSCDVSPKGGPPGFVKVLDERRLAIPDAPGNKLVYSLRNIVASGRAGLLFLIPGMEETLRVNGRACLTRDPAVLQQLADEGKPPKVAIGIEVEEAFLHCP